MRGKLALRDAMDEKGGYVIGMTYAALSLAAKV
jgi:hypothetical protein